MTLPFKLLHYAIIATLALQGLYCLGQLLFVLSPPDVAGPLFSAAATIDHDLLVARRLYSIEGWIALVGLAIYLGITEVLPRRRADPYRSPSAAPALYEHQVRGGDRSDGPKSGRGHGR